MSGPLEGFRIIDVTQMVSGPMAAMILGDQGADVIKVEPPGIGDLTRALGGARSGMAPIFATTNRNKRSVVLDLKDRRGVELLKALSGLASIQGDAVTGRPRMVRLIVSDKITALTAAQAMTAALLERERTGRGQHVRLAMLDALVSLLWAEGMARHTFIRADTGGGRPG